MSRNNSQTQTQTQTQITEARRLTLISTSRPHHPVKANIPQFSLSIPLPPSPNLKPLPKPKVTKPIKLPKTSQEKKTEKKEGYRKKLEKNKALRLEKERGPLPEVEEGEYDEFGFWIAYEKQVVEDHDMEQGDDREGNGGQLRLRGGGEGREESSSGLEENHEIAMKQVLDDLQAMPSNQTFTQLLDGEKRTIAPETHHQVPAASTAPRGQGTQKRKRQENPLTLHDLSSGPSRPEDLTHPMLDKRSQAQYPISAMRGNIEEDEDVQMPVSAQPRRKSIYETEFDSQEDQARLSPTELNSSAVPEPVSRSQTRRSNDRSRVYSLQPIASFEWDSQQDPHPCPLYAVSDTQPDSPDSSDSSDSPRYVSAPGPSRVKTYAKGSKSAPTRHSTTTSRNPAQRPGFKDLFSPEPEWEQEHLTGASTKDRSKRAGSTSWWPEPDTPALVDDQESEEDDDEDGEELGGGLRHILGEVEVNEHGHRIVRGRNRIGPWPSQGLKGLFDDDSQDFHRSTEYYRPVSDRLHLVKVKEEPQDTLVQDTPPSPDEIKISRSKKHNIRANHDRPIVHPPPQLIMRREQSVADRLHDYTHKVNARQSKHQAHLPYNPVVHTNIKSKIRPIKKRRSRFEIPNLPPSVLKPIATIPAEEYRKQLKSRNPGDGFLNPVLIKAGRLGTRDAIIRQHQVRIRSTGRRGVKTQTPIVDDNGEPDPIVVFHTQVPRDEQPGFAVRRLERVKATTARYQKLRPKLSFTSKSPPPTFPDQHVGGNAMRFTTRSPPRPRHDDRNFEIELEMDDQDENTPTARPALDVPGLIAPKVGFGTRYKKVVNFDNDKTAETPSIVSGGQGFIRRRPGYQWDPSSGEVKDEPIYHNDNDTDREVPVPSSTLPMQMGHYGNESNKKQEPLFLSHDDFDKDMEADDDRDLESNTSKHDPPSSPDPQSKAKDDTSTGLSGAQLCNNLLQSAARLPIPLKRTSKSRREEKREEMARRITERDSQTPRPEVMRLSDKVQGYGPLFDELELDLEEEGIQPTMSQLKRRAEFGFKVGSGEEGMIGTQVREEEIEHGSTLPATQNQLTTQLSSFQPDIGPPARNPGRSDPTPDTPAISTVNDTAPSKLKKTTSKSFQPPKSIAKPTASKQVSVSKTRSGPRWATEQDVA